MFSIILAACLATPPYPFPPKVDAPKCSCLCGCATSGVCSCGKPKTVPPPPPVVKKADADPFTIDNASTRIALDPSMLPAPPAGKRWESVRCFGIGKGCEYRLADVVAAPVVSMPAQQQFAAPSRGGFRRWR